MRKIIRRLLNYRSEQITIWTKLDKYKAGLDPNDGADTDGDGLTDKEEIEVVVRERDF